jgi:adenine-specific DNA-methyltransferase
VVDWPRVIRKPQGYAVIEEADVKKALLPAGCYVLVKRFSAKEERRRIVAAVWDPMINGNVPVAVENHLNVFHNSGAGLNREVAWGLSLWLNSTLVDQYFRTFSGHTQVNATDLRTLRFPALAALQRIGGRLAGNSMPEQKQLDGLVASLIRTDPAR